MDFRSHWYTSNQLVQKITPGLFGKYVNKSEGCVLGFLTICVSFTVCCLFALVTHIFVRKINIDTEERRVDIRYFASRFGLGLETDHLKKIITFVLHPRRIGAGSPDPAS